MKLSDLFESSTVILEARHDDLWKGFLKAFEKRLKKDFENIKDSEYKDLVFHIEYLNASQYGNQIEVVSNLSVHSSWKMFFTEWLIGFVSWKLKKGMDVEDHSYKFPESIKFFTRKIGNWKWEGINANKFVEALTHYSGINYQPIQNFNPLLMKEKTVRQFLYELNILEYEYSQEVTDGLVPETGEEKLLVQAGDMAWYDLGKSYCKEEGEAMRHCGNVDGKTNTTDRILSLRQKVLRKGQTFYRPFLTFIIDAKGLLGEMKGHFNNKPEPKFHEAILELLKLDIIKGIKGGGYKPENNFSLDDLSDADRKIILELRGEEWLSLDKLQNNPSLLHYIENPPDKLLKKLLEVNPYAIQYIKNPSEDLQMVVANHKLHSFAFREIDKPTENVQVAAVSNNPLLIEYIDRPSIRVQRIAIHGSIMAINLIKSPSDEAQKLHNYLWIE